MKIEEINYVSDEHEDMEGYKVPGYIEFIGDKGTVKINALWFEKTTEKKIVEKIKRIVLMNCNIMTVSGNYITEKINLKKVMRLMKNAEIMSAIGHTSTASILSTLLGVKMKTNRIKYQHTKDDICIVFQLRDRVEEGKILNEKEIEEIGYDFYITTYTGKGK